MHTIPPEAAVAIAFISVLCGLPALGFLLKWVLKGVVDEIKAAVAELHELAKTVNRHETDLTVSSVRLGKLEAEVALLRERLKV